MISAEFLSNPDHLSGSHILGYSDQTSFLLKDASFWDHRMLTSSLKVVLWEYMTEFSHKESCKVPMSSHVLGCSREIPHSLRGNLDPGRGHVRRETLDTRLSWYHTAGIGVEIDMDTMTCWAWEAIFALDGELNTVLENSVRCRDNS